MSRRAHTFSWLVGLAALIAIISYFQPDGFASSLRQVGITGVAAWLAATFVARFLSAEVPVRLLNVLGCRMSRMQLFAIGWLRTFSNQVVPMTGIAVYVQQLRRSTAASWQDLGAASTQQIFVNVAALGLVGLIAVLSNAGAIAGAVLPLTILFSVMVMTSLASALGVSWVVNKLPDFLLKRIAEAADSFGRLSADRALVLGLVGVQAISILLRAARIWMLFTVLGVVLDWQQSLLIVALAEVTVLISITPGGLGIREAIIIGGATILALPTDIAVTVSLIDRLFVVAFAGLASGPSAMYLYRKSPPKEQAE